MKPMIRMTAIAVVSGAALMLAAGVAAADGRKGHGAFPGSCAAGAMAAERGAGLGPAFAEIDADGNGLITEEDLKAKAAARFAEQDTDGNGSISAEEIAARMSDQIGERMAARGPARRGMDPQAMVDRMAERMIFQRDANKDGVLTPEELEPAKGFGRMIDRHDTDDDNALSEAEYDEARKEMSRVGARHAGRMQGRDRCAHFGSNRW